MTPFILIILALGIVIGYMLAQGKNTEKGEEKSTGKITDVETGGGKETLIQKQADEKEANKKAILTIMETQSPLTNRHVEQLLGIPESTVTRYFDELEKEGKVVQHGQTGRDVYYTLV